MQPNPVSGNVLYGIRRDLRQQAPAPGASPNSGPNPQSAPPRVIPALGPKMLELARDACQGAHPYFTSPDHTAMALPCSRSVVMPPQTTPASIDWPVPRETRS